MLTKTEKVKLILQASSSIASIEMAISQIEKQAVKKYKEALSERPDFVDVDDYNVVDDIKGDDGIRRFTVKNSKDGFVMIPDADGFWSPYCDIKGEQHGKTRTRGFNRRVVE